jgi:E3 ubiquitin-protein ligase EDD1
MYANYVCFSSGAGNGSSSGAGSNSGNGGSSTSKTAQASSRQLARSTRARIMRTSGSSVRGQTSRSTGVIIGGTTSGRSLVTVPATFVPEELISQAQVVLQGKSRNLIIRELQRTNLDVNLAVNNLLSRDDEEGEDTEEGSDNYVPEDLISLLDSGIHPDPSLLLDNDAMFSEDMRTFRNLMLSSRDRMQSSSAPSANQSESSNLRTSGTSGVSAVVSGSSSGTSTSLTFGRLRDRTYFGPRRWFQSSREEVQWEKEQETRNKLDTSSGFPLWISDDLEYWPEKDGTRFASIAALHSEFIALSSKGELHQWRWADREPYRNNEQPNIHHPKTLILGLAFEKISHVSATTIRCSAVTESGKIATWMDEQLGYAGNKLEHSATSYPEFTLDKITSLHTCSLYTMARTESGELFWWGVLPFSQRKKMWEKYKAKSKKPQKKDKDKDASTSEVTVGAQVCMKNSPMYQPGAIGFCVSSGVPKVGQLMNAAWDLMNICRFKILPMPPLSSTSTSSSGSVNVASEPKEKVSAQVTNTNSNSSGSTSSVGNKETADRLDMPPPPSPASSTCSDTSVSVKRKRVTQKDDSDNKKDEEFWNLKDVVFVEDVRSVPVGRVLKVDGQFAAVRFPSTNSKDKFDESSTDAWQDCRLLRKEDLQIIKSTATSRVPDCIQKIPRRVVLNLQLNEHSQLLTLTIDSKGIHTIMKTGLTLHYSLFNLSGGRMGKSSNFPTDLNSFMGKSPQNISLMCAGDQPESILILRDGNKTIYPLAKDCLEAIRDPLWMDLPPLSCIAATPVTIQSTNVNKTQVTLVVLATEQQLLMPKIMRCDVDAIKFYLQQLNNELKVQVSSVVQEFADGNRNILHASVTQCSPTSNKDSDQELPTTATNTSSSSGPNIVLECINAVANSMISSRPSSNIRDLMRRSSSTSALAAESHHMSTGVSVSSADDNSINLSYWPGEYDGGNSGDEDSLSGIHMQKSQMQNQSADIYVSDPTERRLNALLSVQMICENAALQPHLRQLLSAKDSTGQTPFMLAVSSRSYQAGIVIFEAVLKIANGDASIRDSMVFPNGCTPDQSPLHVICCNDTCSFTWTGADHINQDIFECQTCGELL